MGHESVFFLDDGCGIKGDHRFTVNVGVKIKFGKNIVMSKGSCPLKTKGHHGILVTVLVDILELYFDGVSCILMVAVNRKFVHC